MNNQVKPGFSEPQPKIRVLLVDDSQLALALLKKMLFTSLEIEVVGTAINGLEALELIPKLNPTVVCTDLHMPIMDGLELTREIMDRYPRPILVISASVSEGSHNVFQLMEAGAVDVLKKPGGGGTESEFLQQASALVNRLKILAGVHVFRREKKSALLAAAHVPAKLALPAKKTSRLGAVAVGASTGGPQAFQDILSQLPADYPLPLICVQHIGEGFMEGLVEWIQASSALKVEIAREGAFPEPGVAYFPRDGAHLIIDGNGKFSHSLDMPFGGHRPSITVTFKSVAEHYKDGSIGVLLTGMGSDGSEGLKKIAEVGGITIAQDENSCVVYGMPKRALELGAVQKMLPLGKIASALISCVNANGEKIL